MPKARITGWSDVASFFSRWSACRGVERGAPVCTTEMATAASAGGFRKDGDCGRPGGAQELGVYKPDQDPDQVSHSSDYQPTTHKTKHEGLCEYFYPAKFLLLLLSLLLLHYFYLSSTATNRFYPIANTVLREVLLFASIGT